MALEGNENVSSLSVKPLIVNRNSNGCIKIVGKPKDTFKK